MLNLDSITVLKTLHRTAVNHKRVFLDHLENLSVLPLLPIFSLTLSSVSLTCHSCSGEPEDFLEIVSIGANVAQVSFYNLLCGAPTQLMYAWHGSYLTWPTPQLPSVTMHTIYVSCELTVGLSVGTRVHSVTGICSVLKVDGLQDKGGVGV